ncbi:MAG: threonine-phosphate decarboxylase CobD [Candidatus Adiutrix sp.]|jgi:threonine-phosphate decarboxylase|nr:threonine-phosphate decarboxylase CobD [Candidatus Adiutrix sp.]
MSAVHGGRVFEAARRLGRPWSEIIDFSANINPLGQPQGLKKAIFEDFDRTLHYPEVMAESLLEYLAADFRLSPEYFLAGAGSTPHFHLLARSLGLARPVIIGPAFAEYEGALNRAGLEARYVLTREADGWQVTPETLVRLWAAQPDAVFLAHPANPTGRLVPPPVLRELAGECAHRGVWLVLDEAFIDFTEGESLLPLVAENPRLIVLRSLTKIFALPGLRLAFMAAHPEVMARLRPLAEPWGLSSPAIRAGNFCLAQKNFRQASAETTRQLRRHLIRELTELNLGDIFPSEANFLLLKLRQGLTPRPLLNSLFQDGILVRDAANFHGLKPGFLRLAVRPVPEIAALTASLRKFFHNGAA